MRSRWTRLMPTNAAHAAPTRNAASSSTSRRRFPRLLSRTRCSPAQHENGGVEQDHHVEPEGGPLHVFDVVLDPLLEILARLARALELPQACDSRSHAQSQVAPRRTELVLVIGAGSGPDQTHFAAHHVPELRQFVKIGFAQKSSDPRDARIVLDVDLRPIALVVGELPRHLMRIRPHGAELPGAE